VDRRRGTLAPPLYSFYFFSLLRAFCLIVVNQVTPPVEPPTLASFGHDRSHPNAFWVGAVTDFAW